MGLGARDVAARLESRKARNGWMARCPAHDDRRRSLSIGEADDGRVLLKCHAGCSFERIVAAMRLEPRDLAGTGKRESKDAVVASYEYRDEQGKPLMRVVRDSSKRFWQERADGSGGWLKGVRGVPPVPYRLPELLAADPDALVFVVEGEKDVDRLRSVGLIATCNAGGAGKWKPEHSQFLRGRDVVVVPDNDEAGRRHAAQVQESLSGTARRVRNLKLSVREKGDVSEWLDAGGTRGELLSLVAGLRDRPPPGLRVVRLSEVEPEAVNWIWPGRVPLGKITLIEGDPGLGKSTLTLDLAARLTTGGILPCGSHGGEPRRVLVVSVEDGVADTIRPRLDAAGGDANRVDVLTGVTDANGHTRAVTLPDDIGAIERFVRKNEISLVIIDPLMAFLGGTVDSHKDQHVRGALAPLASMAEETGAAVVVVRHLNKSEGRPAMYRGGGSIGIIGAARSALLVATDRDDPDVRVLASVKSNLAGRSPALRYRLAPTACDVARIEWLGIAHGVTADDLLAPRQASVATATTKATEWLSELLSEGPMDRAEVMAAAEEVHFSEKVVRCARKVLGVVCIRSGKGTDHKTTWQLPTHALTAVGHE